MPLIKPVQHADGNVVKVIPAEFRADSPDLERLKVQIEPAGYVSIVNYLHRRVLSTFQAALGKNPIYEGSGSIADLSELLENERVQELVASSPGIGICLPHGNGKTTVLVRESKLVALACSSDLEYWASFWAVQPANLNDALVEYVNGRHPVPIKFGDIKSTYSLEGHSIEITRQKVPSVRGANVERRLTGMLDTYGIR